MLTKDDAEKIATKLKARFKSGKAHDIAIIEYGGKRIVQFGIRRGSRRNQGHDHIPSSLHVKAHDAKELAICTMSLEQWIALMKEKGLIESKA